jgi:hypothetical protein
MHEPLAGKARVFVQIPERASLEAVPPALPAMFGCVVEDVTALA